MALEAGTRLGHYEVVSSLGAGGMGEVYRAKDTKLGREVAIKLLLEEVSQDPERMARFEREARVLASLNHNNIATLHGFEQEGDTSFLVMELVEGETLADRIKRGAIPVNETISLFLQIAEGLEAAHEKGVIHRDLKPANIKVTDDGNVKILDFGLAKAMAPASVTEMGPSESPTITAAGYDLTRQGQIMGTAAYMSPEQATGGSVDQQTDIWAFGAVFFEALTGRRLFDGETSSQVLAEVLKTDPDWDRLPAETPTAVRRVLRRCLAKNTHKRLRNIDAARLDLQEETNGAFSAVGTPPAAARESKPKIIQWGLSFGLGAAIAAAVFWGLQPARQSRTVHAVISATPSEPAMASSYGHDLAMTRDGQTVVYRTSGSLFVRQLGELSGWPIQSGVDPFFSPDGSWIAFAEGHRILKKVSASGGQPVTICDLPGFSRGATWGSDGSIVFAVFGGNATGLHRVSADGGEPDLVAAPEALSGETHYFWPEFLPDGETVLFTAFKGLGLDPSIKALSLKTGEQRVVLRGGTHGRYVSTGHLVYGLEGTLMATAFDLETLQAIGRPVTVFEGVVTKFNGAANFAVSEDGSLVYMAGQASKPNQRTLVWVNREGEEEVLPVPIQAYNSVDISPNGQRVAVDSLLDERDVWVWDLGGEVLTRLTLDDGVDSYPKWTSDGEEVIFSSNRGGSIDLYRKAADGTGTAQQLTSVSEELFASSISMDAATLFYRSGQMGESSRIGRLSLEEGGGTETLLASEFNQIQPVISPDGNWLAYSSNESGRHEIYVRPYPELDSKRQISSEGGREPVWSADGKELFYRRSQSPAAMLAVRVETDSGFRAGRPEVLFEEDYYASSGRSFDVSSDGEKFLMIKAAGPESEAAEYSVVWVSDFGEKLERLVPTD